MNISTVVNSSLFIKIGDLEESLKNGKTQKCLAWCIENKSRLRKIKSRFEVILMFLMKLINYSLTGVYFKCRFIRIILGNKIFGIGFGNFQIRIANERFRSQSI